MDWQRLYRLALACVLCSSPAFSHGNNLTEPASHRHSKPPDINQDIYYKNRHEVSFETGFLPINIPFAFDFLTSGAYNKTPLNYTLVPNIASFRWQLGKVGGPKLLRGNWDATFGGTYTAIPRGPESRYWASLLGFRRNFIQPDWRIVPYFDGRVGMGNIDAMGPKGVSFAQGQDLTFTFLIGSGVSYNFNARYGISAGLTYMHISNMYLSEPKYLNFGINVYGPMVGLNVRLGRRKRPYN